ncbi:MAG: DUF4168 domain-containing protein [Gemmatimonadales bacterium]|nr:MAG: DUF4168 domain-containing protein [Gemmatimonadales bacterium]
MRERMTRLMTLPALALAMAIAAPAGVEAQMADTPDQEELVQFTEAFLEVTDIRQDMEAQVAQVQSPEEANALQQQANDQMVAVLDEHGLTTERYSEIVNLINQDEEVRNEFEELLVELTGDGLGGTLF